MSNVHFNAIVIDDETLFLFLTHGGDDDRCLRAVTQYIIVAINANY